MPSPLFHVSRAGQGPGLGLSAVGVLWASRLFKLLTVSGAHSGVAFALCGFVYLF